VSTRPLDQPSLRSAGRGLYRVANRFGGIAAASLAEAHRPLRTLAPQRCWPTRLPAPDQYPTPADSLGICRSGSIRCRHLIPGALFSGNTPAWAAWAWPSVILFVFPEETAGGEGVCIGSGNGMRQAFMVLADSMPMQMNGWPIMLDFGKRGV